MVGSGSRLWLTLVGLPLLLAGCGTAPQPSADAAAHVHGAPVLAGDSDDYVAKPMQGRWLATAACSVIDRQEVANAVRAWVQTTELTDVTYPTRRRSAASTCLYTLANGSSVALLTREMPRPSLTDAVIEEARLGDGTAPPWDRISGLGRAALWSGDRNTLQLFLDDRRFVAIDITDPPADRDPKAMMMAIARKIS